MINQVNPKTTLTFRKENEDPYMTMELSGRIILLSFTNIVFHSKFLLKVTMIRDENLKFLKKKKDAFFFIFIIMSKSSPKQFKIDQIYLTFFSDDNKNPG